MAFVGYMICVAALIVFTVLALFSARYRSLAKEAWACVFLKVRLRPCNSGLDKRVRMMAVAPFLKRSPKTARVVYTIFPAISFVFVLLTVISLVYLVWGGYNYALYGNCNGPGSTGFCVFDPNGAESSAVPECSEIAKDPSSIVIPTEAQLEGFKVIHPEGTTTVVFIGCYSCPYTREGSNALFETIDAHPDVRFVLVDFPLAQHANSTLAANAGNCVYDRDPASYPSYARLLYTVDLAQGLPASTDADTAVCAASEHLRVTAGKNLGLAMNVYGTPTYIIHGKAYVGPLNERSLRKLIDG
jgi:protein-disulfide isomerase